MRGHDPVAVTKRPAIISRSVADDAAGTREIWTRFKVEMQAIYGTIKCRGLRMTPKGTRTRRQRRS
jgi:hypothetical protein